MRNPFASLLRAFCRPLRAPPAAYAATFIAILILAPLIAGLALVAVGRTPWTMGLPFDTHSNRLRPVQLGWWDRSFQDSVSARINGHMPLRNKMLNIGNEFDYRILRTSRTFHDEIIIGKGGQLFTMSYVAEALGYRPDIPDAYFHDIAGKFKRLHTLLAQRNISLLVIGTPSKLSVARDAVPVWFRDRRPGVPRNYDRMMTIFSERGVPFIDGRAAMLNSEFNGRDPLFPRGGLHWNLLGAYAAAQPLIARLLAERSPDQTSRLVLDAVTFVRPPSLPDRDLLAILGLLFPDRSYSSPRLTIRLEGKPLPKGISMIGTSFLNAIVEVLEPSGIAPQVVESSYLLTIRRCATCAWERVPNDWAQRLLADSSALVVEINESASFTGSPYLPALFDRLLAVLEKSDATAAAH